MVGLALVGFPGLRFVASGNDAAVETGATHTFATGALSVVVLLLFGAVLVFAVLIRGMLATVAQVMGQAAKLFGMLVLALVVLIVVLTGVLSHASTPGSPAPPNPSPEPASVHSAPPARP